MSKPTEKDPFEKMRKATEALKQSNKDAESGKKPTAKAPEKAKKKFKNTHAAAAFLAAASLGFGGAAFLTGDSNDIDIVDTDRDATIEYIAPITLSPSLDLNDFSLTYDYNYNALPPVITPQNHDFSMYDMYDMYDITPVDPIFDTYDPYNQFSPLNPYHRLPY